VISYRRRAAAKHAITRSFGNLLANSKSATRFACFCYHSVSSTGSDLSVEPAVLKQHIELLRRWGFQFVTVGEVAAAIASGTVFREPTIALSFDDGYKDNLTQALPILLANSVRASFYITSGLAAGDAQIISRFREMTKYESEYLTVGDIRELHAAGMEIGAHTHTHRNLARLPAEVARQELQISKDWLEKVLGNPVEQFAFPFGKRGIHYNNVTLGLVRDCGYRGAAVVESRSASSVNALDQFQIPRFYVTREDSAMSLKDKLDGALNWLGWFQAYSPRWLKAAISPEDARA
jgi:peptidoglycan/xylan/chitin deacetylase (PgdA/CDA1 family)